MSSALKADSEKVLAALRVNRDEFTIFETEKFEPIDRDPALRRKISSDADRIYLINQGPFQPKLSRYPRNDEIESSKQCHFSSDWYRSFPHLEYSISKDACFCFVCQVFQDGVGHQKADEAWTSRGVRAWHKMKSRGKAKPGKLASHFSSTAHKASLDALICFQSKAMHIDCLLDKDKRKEEIANETESQRNRDAVKVLLDVTRTLARQGLAFRGAGSEKDGSGNFHQITKLVARHSPSFKRWLDDAESRPHTVNYLSSRSQNEFLLLLAEDVTNKVKREIIESEISTVIADTTPDVSHLDQLSVVARYMDPHGNLQERLVDMTDIDKKTGDGQAKQILKSWNKRELNSSSIAFQSYDYTASMSGVFNGCQAMMNQYLGSNIPYFPCLAHRVNTTVEHSCKASLIACKMFDILQEIYVFFSSSTKRYNLFRLKVKELDINGALALRNLSMTRWIARADSIRAVWRSFEGVIAALEALDESEDAKTKVKAAGLLRRVKSFDFIVMLMFMKNVMVKTKILTQEIQSVQINIFDTLEAAQATIATLQHMRDDFNGLDKEIQAALVFGKKCGIDGKAQFHKHHRPRRIPARIDETPENAASIDFNEYYRKECILVLDMQISSLTENVKVPLGILTPAVRILQPPFEGKIEMEDCQRLINMLPAALQPDDSALEAEISIFRSHCAENKPEITSIKEAADYARRFKGLFPLTERCYQLLLTVPITSASSERSFSKLKLIKTLMRSSMKQERLYEMMILACEKDLTDTIDLENTVNRWAKMPKSRRLISVIPSANKDKQMP